jgi:hypothetical protein
VQRNSIIFENEIMENEESNIVAFTGYRGEMTKNVLEMDFAERQEWKKEINQKIRTYLFSINMPLVHKIDGKVVAEFADGRIEIIR